ncbi:MAG: mechanosensitive ion channel [Halofilum sp. (in: g-proteobacteria)]|nr:mechanosensitive ion channel [Halofilum sp. (in: g-proteobacteria)]
MIQAIVSHPLVVPLLATAALFAVVAALRLLIGRRIRAGASILGDLQRRQLLYLRSALTTILLVGLVAIWLGRLENALLSLTAVAVAIVIATKELLMCITGFLVRTTGRLFALGDWIECDGMRGEVTDQTLLATRLLEVESGENGYVYTGRTVSLPNSLFLNHPVRTAPYAHRSRAAPLPHHGRGARRRRGRARLAAGARRGAVCPVRRRGPAPQRRHRAPPRGGRGRAGAAGRRGDHRSRQGPVQRAAAVPHAAGGRAGAGADRRVPERGPPRRARRHARAGGAGGRPRRLGLSAAASMQRLAILYPPSGAEFEYYAHGERLGDDVRITLLGVRIFGDDDEHAPQHLRRTAALGNLECSARAIARLQPDAAIWACTSGSFIDGLGHARAQAGALEAALGCPASSTSLAFVDALAHLGIARVSVLASYPEATTGAFVGLLGEAGMTTDAVHCLDAASGPAAAALEPETWRTAARALEVAPEGALLVPDTAVPTLDWLEALERELGRTVLSANQVSLWRVATLAGLDARRQGLGRLFRPTALA